MGIIHLEEMEFYAYHGHFVEEQIVGSNYLVDIRIETDTDTPAQSDNLKDALDYQELYEIVKQEMKIKSHLLEHLVKRIIDKIFDKFNNRLKFVWVRVSKLNPPLGGKTKKVSIEMERYN